MRLRTLGILGAVFLMAAVVLGTFGTALAQQAGPYGSSWGPGGMMGGWGGPGGMMGGWGGGPGGMMGGWGWNSPSGGNTISIVQAKQAVENYISSTGNPNLQIDEVMEFQNNFYAIIKEKDTGKGAMEVLVNKSTGSVFPEYGPNMMWNTKYSPMAGMMRGWWGGAPSGQEGVSADQAKSIAQQWLDANQPGSTPEEEPDAFHGYYTLHTLKDGKVTGMLSVNAYTGQVWYHNWHGAFIRMESED